ncbi:MAG TPA: hypothetical protein VH436_25815 [Vicinamibacterales bacterium]
MRKCVLVCALALLVITSRTAPAIAGETTFVVTSSNAVNNELLVFDESGTLIQAVPTQGAGGVSGNAGGVAALNGSIAVINSGSQSVSLFGRGGNGFDLRQLIATASPPVSVTFGKDHLYILGTQTIESHRIAQTGVEPTADGTTTLVRGDGSAAQAGVVGDRLIVTEKSGAVETVALTGGAVSGTATSLTVPADVLASPFGFVTRGSSAYITVAGSDEVVLLRNGEVLAQTATGVPNGSGQHSPCWAALLGPFLFTANSPSHSISRLIATGHSVTLDAQVAANTTGAPIDIAATGDLLAVVESNANGTSRVTQFRVDEDGHLTQTVTNAIGTSANGVAIVSR